MRESDLEDLYEYHSDPDTVRYINWPVRTKGQVMEALGKYSLVPDFSKDGDSALLGWELKETGKIIGQCSFTFESIHNQNGMVGYVMNPKFAGKGFAFEAVSALIAHVFKTFEVSRIVATIDPRNDKSIALITRLGFIHERTLIQNELIKDEWVDTAHYVIVRSEFEKARKQREG